MPGSGNSDDNYIWGMRLGDHRIQVTIGCGDRGFHVLFTDEGYGLAAALRSPGFEYAVLGRELDFDQRQELARTIHRLLKYEEPPRGN